MRKLVLPQQIPISDEGDNAVLKQHLGGVYEELRNYISDLEKSLTAPAGTRLIFDQDTVPLGWTRDAVINDRVIRIVSGTRADGGSWTITGLAVNSHTHDLSNHTHTVSHNHTFSGNALAGAIFSLEVTGGVINNIANLQAVGDDVAGSGALVTFQAGGSASFGRKNSTAIQSPGTPSGSISTDAPQSGIPSTNTSGSAAPGVTHTPGWRPLFRDSIIGAKD